MTEEMASDSWDFRSEISERLDADLGTDAFDVLGGQVAGEVGHGVGGAAGGAECAGFGEGLLADESEGYSRRKGVAGADGAAGGDARHADAPGAAGVGGDGALRAERDDRGA